MTRLAFSSVRRRLAANSLEVRERASPLRESRGGFGKVVER